jgi:hypothetical protein
LNGILALGRLLRCALNMKEITIGLVEFHAGTVSNAIPASAIATVIVEEEKDLFKKVEEKKINEVYNERSNVRSIFIDCLADEFYNICKEYENIEYEEDEKKAGTLHLDISMKKIINDNVNTTVTANETIAFSMNGDVIDKDNNEWERWRLGEKKTLSFGYNKETSTKTNKNEKNDEDFDIKIPKYCLSFKDTIHFIDFILSLPDGIIRRMRY